MLRIEATELTVEKQMFIEQKRAYTRVEKLIQTAVDHRKKTSLRANRTIFLSGVAGVGKTSVYLTLRRNSDDTTQNVTAEEKSQLHGKVVWLEPLELFDVQHKPNVLADLLVLIENKIDSKEPFLDTSKKECLQRLQRLQNSVSSVWNASKEDIPTSNAQARAAHIVDTSRERAGLRKELNELIDKVADVFFGKKVIILPIDDLDESYRHAFDVLRLLRLVHSPYLIILAIGDITTIKKIEETRIRSEQIGGERDWAKQHKIMAEYSINKIIPSAQRVNIEPAETESEKNWDKLKAFKPAALDNGKKSSTLFELLSTQFDNSGVKVDMDGDIRWRWLLKAPARDLVDMYHELGILYRHHKTRVLSSKDEEKETRKHELSDLFLLFAWAQAERAVSTIDWPNGDEEILHNLFSTKVYGQKDILRFGIEINKQYTDIIPSDDENGDENDSSLIKLERKNGTSIQLAPLIQAWLRLCHEIDIAGLIEKSAEDEHNAETDIGSSKKCLCLRLRWLPKEYPDGDPRKGDDFSQKKP